MIAAMTSRLPPQVGHRLKSMASTRCTRATQLIGVVRTPGWSSLSVAGLLPVSFAVHYLEEQKQGTQWRHLAADDITYDS
jgi:hypothetical protein